MYKKTELIPGKTYELSVKIRVDKQGNIGGACQVGAYDKTKAKNILKKGVKLAALSNKEYRWVTIGTFTQGEQTFIYIAPTNNTDNVKTIFIDKILLKLI